MNYEETLTYLYASTPAFHMVGAAAYKPGLDNTERLMAHIGHPEQALRCIHIAGTNGKGSCSHLIAATLAAAGYRVGLYTSPHLVDYRERMRIVQGAECKGQSEECKGQSTMIPKERVVQWVADNKAWLEEVRPSFFETTFGMAMQYFREEEVDIAVVETGLGGRLDATNIITPILSLITNIGLDHTEFLGTTRKQIAREKAGIIKPGVPCVVGETDPETVNVFLQRAQECGILGDGLETTDCRLWLADQCGYMRTRRTRTILDCELHGIYQEANLQTVYVALQVLKNYSGLTIPTEAIRTGYAHVCRMTGLRGRWEQLSEQPLTICDTGHNSHGIRYVARQLRQLHEEGRQLHIVLGMVNDKDIDIVLRLMPTEARYYFTQAKTHRAIPAEEIEALWLQLHPEHTAHSAYSEVGAAIAAAQSEAREDDVVFIGGSNYIVGEAIGMYDL